MHANDTPGKMNTPDGVIQGGLTGPSKLHGRAEPPCQTGPGFIPDHGEGSGKKRGWEGGRNRPSKKRRSSKGVEVKKVRSTHFSGGKHIPNLLNKPEYWGLKSISRGKGRHNLQSHTGVGRLEALRNRTQCPTLGKIPRGIEKKNNNCIGIERDVSLSSII